MRRARYLIGAFIMGACLTAPACALTVGQVDTFEDGTTQGWSVGDPTHPVPPANIPNGGPAGADDNYLELTALGGGGAGSRLSAFNLGQWAGNYSAASITGIAMDVRNFGPDDITLRLLLADPVAGPPANLAITDGVFLPAGGEWTSASFSLDPTSLTAGLGSVAGALSGATELRLFHNADPVFVGPPLGSPPINTVLGVDNVRAVGAGGVIPEPSSLALLALGFPALLARRRTRG